MSTGTEGAHVPSWDLADRLRKALREAGLSVQGMADYLDVSRNTVSAWMNGRTPPSTQSLRLWALRTGVPYEWLLHGEPPSRPGPNGGGPGGGFGGESRWTADYRPVVRLFPDRKIGPLDWAGVAS